MIGTCEMRLAMTERPQGAPQQGAGNPEGGKQQTKGLVMVVEDDYIIGSMTEESLLDAGYSVVAVVASGEEAVTTGIDLRPDLVVMDIRLAGEMTGIEAAIALRAHGIRSLFASAHSDPEMRARGEEARPLAWLAKPYTNSEVTAAVASAFAKLKSN